MPQTRRTRNTNRRGYSAALDSLAYIADDLPVEYHSKPFKGLTERELRTTYDWLIKLSMAVSHEMAERTTTPNGR